MHKQLYINILKNMQIIKQKTNTRLMVYSKAQKKRLISGKMNSSPKNVGCSNSKLSGAGS